MNLLSRHWLAVKSACLNRFLFLIGFWEGCVFLVLHNIYQCNFFRVYSSCYCIRETKGFKLWKEIFVACRFCFWVCF